MFKVNNNDLDNVIKKIDDFSLDVNTKILDNNNQLKIEQEKTKQLELEYKTIQNYRHRRRTGFQLGRHECQYLH